MERHFDRDLNLLKEKLITMAGLTESNIQLSIKILVERDENSHSLISQQEQKINALQVEIDDSCLKLLALHQPVAFDLRFIASAMRINAELERIGDQAVNITQSALELIKQLLLKPLVDIPKMADLVQSMVKDSLDSFVKQDSKIARDILKRDDQIDNYKEQIFRELLTFMLQDPTTISRALQLILISRHLERIADHSTNIAEDVVYLVEGIDIRHHSEENRPEES